ncbi:MAG: glycosyltransferase [Muribaculaceae bacterium]|nr:glycosyltransferase [Muribaculaceae bacterium]
MMLLSVGRISHAKNYDNIPDMARRMRELGLRFVWYILGPGNPDTINRKIAETGTADCVKLLGATSNPYPYIKACDIYVQPSRYEGKSVTVREAQILCKPVVITDYPTARSQVQDGVDGIICPMDNASIARAIADLAGDTARRQALSDYLATHDYGNEAEVAKVYQLLPHQPTTPNA